MSKKTEIAIEIPKPSIQVLETMLIGDSRLVVHNWSQKAIDMMKLKQSGKARLKKEPRNPEEDYQSSLYVSTDGWHGVPTNAFKAAFVGGCRYSEGISMVMGRGAIFVESDGEDAKGNSLVEIHGDGPHPREDLVRIAMGTSDIRYRGEWRTWWANVRVRFNANVITEEQIFNLISLAGLHVGICEGRPGAPKSTMDWGQFHPASANEMKKAA